MAVPGATIMGSPRSSCEILDNTRYLLTPVSWGTLNVVDKFVFVALFVKFLPADLVFGAGIINGVRTIIMLLQQRSRQLLANILCVPRNDSSERPSATRSTFLLFFSLIPEALPPGTAQLPVPHGLPADAKADLTQISEGLPRIN